MLTICTYWWGSKYSRDDVDKLIAGVERNVEQDFQFIVVTEYDGKIPGAYVAPIPLHDRQLCGVRGCFVRLRMFDPSWQNYLGADERIVVMDLDSIVTGPLDILFNRPESFVILQGANAANPCPYNGSLWMLRAGYRPDVWSGFDLREARDLPFYEYPDDQGWFANKLPNAPGWVAGPRSGVYAFQKPGWPKNNMDLPKDARLVVFPGWRSPDKFRHLPWVREHWC